MKTIFAKFGNSRISLWNGESEPVHFERTEKLKIRESLMEIEHLVFASVTEDHRDLLLPKDIRFTEIRVDDLPIQYVYADGLGVDRALNIYAAGILLRCPNFVVIDFGTAVCVDFVTESKRHLGGWIAAGPGISSKALHQHTDKLPKVEPRRQEEGLGLSTEECLRVGFQALVNGHYLEAKHHAERLFGGNYQIIVTGGWSSILTIREEIRVEDRLTLIGLKNLWESQRMGR